MIEYILLVALLLVVYKIGVIVGIKSALKALNIREGEEIAGISYRKKKVTRSKLPYLLAITGIFMLACVLPALPAQIPLQMPPASPKQGVDAPQAQEVVNTVTKTPQVLVVLGIDTTWNIRTGAGLSYPIVGIAAGGQEFVKVSIRGGWVETEQGWICSQAFGGGDRCE